MLPAPSAALFPRVKVYAHTRVKNHGYSLFASLLPELCDRWQSALFKDKVDPFHQVVVHFVPLLERQPPELFVDSFR